MSLESDSTISGCTFLSSFIYSPQSISVSCPLSAGSVEDGLSGSRGQTGHGLCPPDHSGGGGRTLEGAGREARQGVTAADGCLRGAAS